MKRLVSLLAVLIFIAFPVSALAAEPAPEKGEIEEVVPDAVYYFAIGRVDANLASKNVFESNLAYFLNERKDLRVQSLTPRLGPATSNCAVPNSPIPGRTSGYWVFVRKALSGEPGQKLEYFPWKPGFENDAQTVLKTFPEKAHKIVAVVPVNAGDGGALSGYYVIFTDN